MYGYNELTEYFSKGCFASFVSDNSPDNIAGCQSCHLYLTQKFFQLNLKCTEKTELMDIVEFFVACQSNIVSEELNLDLLKYSLAVKKDAALFKIANLKKSEIKEGSQEMAVMV